MRQTKLSLLQKRFCLQRKANGIKSVMSGPDLTILYSSDAEEWDHYLSECFIQMTKPHPIVIEHEKIEDVSTAQPDKLHQSFTSAKVVLVILSPDFLEHVDNHAEVYELGKLLKPGHTLAMLCGVQEEDVTRIHKAALVSYDSWPRLVAKDQDKDFVLSVINTTMDLLQRAEESQNARKPQFKLSPRKVREGNGKVFVILNKPVGEKQKIQILLEGDGVKEVPTKWRNPYTLQFMVPDNCMQVSRILNVHVLCDDTLFGVRQLKCESKLGELYTLLTSVNSPYEFLCRTMGVASLHEVDEELVRRFRQNVPSTGFSLLELTHEVGRKKSEEELPTLLHFSARYGLQELTSQLLQCPNAQDAAKLRNVQGLTPAQLANHAGHNEIAAMLDDFQNLCNSNEWEQKSSVEEFYETMNERSNKSSPAPSFRSSTPVDVSIKVSDADSDSICLSNEYLKMSNFRKFSAPVGIFKSEECLSVAESPVGTESQDKGRKQRASESDLDSTDNSFCGSQRELIEILKEFKKGASITDVEGMFREWQKKHKHSDNEAQLDQLRQLYKQSQSSSHKKKLSRKQPFSFGELRNYISQKLNIKDSQPQQAKQSTPATLERLDAPPMKDPKLDSLFRPISVVSTASVGSSSSSSSTDRFSTFSASSSCDSGNHSDSCDEGTRLKDILRDSSKSDPRSPYSFPPRPVRVPSGLLGERPPAPPPRPRRGSLPMASTTSEKLSVHEYYKYPPSPLTVPTPAQTQRTSSPEYVAPDADEYLSTTQVDEAIKAIQDASKSSTKEDGPQDDGEHYQRPPSRPMCVSSMCKLKAPNNPWAIQKPPKYQHVIHQLQKDAGPCYDFIPMPPVPVGRVQAKDLASVVVPAADYDIPRPLYQVPRNSKKLQQQEQ